MIGGGSVRCFTWGWWRRRKNIQRHLQVFVPPPEGSKKVPYVPQHFLRYAILGPIKNIIFDQLCVAIVMPKMWLLNKGTKKKLFPEEQTQ